MTTITMQARQERFGEGPGERLSVNDAIKYLLNRIFFWGSQIRVLTPERIEVYVHEYKCEYIITGQAQNMRLVHRLVTLYALYSLWYDRDIERAANWHTVNQAVTDQGLDQAATDALRRQTQPYANERWPRVTIIALLTYDLDLLPNYVQYFNRRLGELTALAEMAARDGKTTAMAATELFG